MIHRIVYQDDECVIVACGLHFWLTRTQARECPYITLWRGSQTCPDCPDEIEEIPEAMRFRLTRRRDV